MATCVRHTTPGRLPFTASTLVTSRHASSRLASPRYATPRHATPRHASHRIATPRIASPRLASPRLATPRLASPRLATPRHASPRLASPRLARRRLGDCQSDSLYCPAIGHGGRGHTFDRRSQRRIVLAKARAEDPVSRRLARRSALVDDVTRRRVTSPRRRPALCNAPHRVAFAPALRASIFLFPEIEDFKPKAILAKARAEAPVSRRRARSSALVDDVTRRRVTSPRRRPALCNAFHGVEDPGCVQRSAGEVLRFPFLSDDRTWECGPGVLERLVTGALAGVGRDDDASGGLTRPRRRPELCDASHRAGVTRVRAAFRW